MTDCDFSSMDLVKGKISFPDLEGGNTQNSDILIKQQSSHRERTCSPHVQGQESGNENVLMEK